MNEDPTEKLIRELKEENEKLKKRMAAGKIDADFIDEDGDGIDDRGNEFVEKFPLALLTLHSLFFSYLTCLIFSEANGLSKTFICR